MNFTQVGASYIPGLGYSVRPYTSDGGTRTDDDDGVLCALLLLILFSVFYYFLSFNLLSVHLPPVAVMSYRCQSVSTSVKLTALKGHFYDLSDVFKSVVKVKKLNMAFEVFFFYLTPIFSENGVAHSVLNGQTLSGLILGSFCFLCLSIWLNFYPRRSNNKVLTMYSRKVQQTEHQYNMQHDIMNRSYSFLLDWNYLVMEVHGRISLKEITSNVICIGI